MKIAFATAFIALSETVRQNVAVGDDVEILGFRVVAEHTPRVASGVRASMTASE